VANVLLAVLPAAQPDQKIDPFLTLLAEQMRIFSNNGEFIELLGSKE
jgi:hypothetical protein